MDQISKKNHHKCTGVKSRWCVRDHKCTGIGRWPITSETVLQEGANFKRHRLERIAQTYKVVTALDWCCSEGVVGTCRLQEERERVTALKRHRFKRIVQTCRIVSKGREIQHLSGVISRE